MHNDGMANCRTFYIMFILRQKHLYLYYAYLIKTIPITAAILVSVQPGYFSTTIPGYSVF